MLGPSVGMLIRWDFCPVVNAAMQHRSRALIGEPEFGSIEISRLDLVAVLKTRE